MHMKKMFTLVCLLLLAALPAMSDNLIFGSSSSDSARFTFEKHDDSGALLVSGNLNIGRANHTATLLANGSIFVAGSFTDPISWQIFDQSGNVLSSGNLLDQRYGHAATLLSNHNVFLAGGNANPGTWEIHSPTGSLISSGNLSGYRTQGLSAVTLQNGNIWVSGSGDGEPDSCTYEIHTSSGTLVTYANLRSCFSGGQVQVLSNGNVILLGGDNNASTYEIRDQTGTFITTGTLHSTFNSGANSVVLTNGDVFIFGSCTFQQCNSSGSPQTWEIRDVNGNFVSTGSLSTTRESAGAALLSNGNVFITGGDTVYSTWEIRSSTGAFVSTGSLADNRRGGHTVTHF